MESGGQGQIHALPLTGYRVLGKRPSGFKCRFPHLSNEGPRGTDHTGPLEPGKGSPRCLAGSEGARNGWLVLL